MSLPIAPSSKDEAQNTNPPHMITTLKNALTIPPLRETKKSEAATAETPQEAVSRLRDLVDKTRGWRARAEARRAEIAELTPDSPRDALEIDDESLNEISRLQVQLTIAEAALKQIREDERNLITLAAPLIETLKTRLDDTTARRVDAVEKAARAVVAKIIPTESIERVIGLLPTVQQERAMAHNLRNAGSGISWKFSGGPNPLPVPSEETTALAVVNSVESLERAIAEAEGREKAPISFAI